MKLGVPVDKSFMDLYGEIIDNEDYGWVHRAGIYSALEWIDQNFDKTPNLILTEGQFVEHVEWRLPTWQAGFRFAMDLFGVDYVPDPKSENAKRLDEILKDWPGQASAGDPTLGEYLASRGVTAEEMDDDV